MDSLPDQAIMLEQIDPRIASLVSDRVVAARGWVARFDAMEELIGSRVASSEGLPYIGRAWDRLVATGGRATIASLAADIGCSHRHLIQQFRTCIGVPPKKAAMLVQFDRSLDALSKNGRPDSPRKPYLEGSAPSGSDAVEARCAQIAAECGYFDQSHFIHEFSAFAGVTPSQFQRGIPAA